MKHKIDVLWSNLRVINNETWPDNKFEFDTTEFRLDDSGAIIKKGEYGNESEFGWNVDHSFQVINGGDDNIDNLQLLHWKNNKAKGDNFPKYTIAVTRSNERDIFKNREIDFPVTWSPKVISSLKNLYPNVKLYPIPGGKYHSLPDFYPVSTRE
jgi:hypothetical protein